MNEEFDLFLSALSECGKPMILSEIMLEMRRLNKTIASGLITHDLICLVNEARAQNLVNVKYNQGRLADLISLRTKGTTE